MIWIRNYFYLFLQSSIVFISIIFIQYCAVIKPPSGGPMDTTPPYLVHVNPPSGSLNYKGEKIILQFSEYMNSNSIEKGIRIFPNFKDELSILIHGDIVTINFPDDLEKDQTYVINLSRNITDEHGVELAELRELFDSGVVAFSDDGTPVWDSHIMQMALLYSREFGVPVTDHCEDLQLNQGWVVHEGWVSSRLGLPGYPSSGEESMVARNIALTELTGGQLHLAHLSTAGSVDLVRLAKARGLRVTAEVTPQHLTMSEEWVLGSETADHTQALTTGAYDSFAKVNPPLRTKKDAAALLDGLKDGTIDAIATDHAPHTWEEKQEAYLKAPSGMPLNQHFLLVLLDFYAQGIFSLEQIVQKTSHNIAERFQIKDRGYLREGSFADLAVVDLSDQTLVTKEDILYYCKWSPFLDHTFSGAVKYTIINGKVVFQDGKFLKDLPLGKRIEFNR